MHARHIVVVVAVLSLGFGAKLLLFPATKAKAEIWKSGNIVDIRALMSKIDVAGMPQQNILSEADE